MGRRCHRVLDLGRWRGVPRTSAVKFIDMIADKLTKEELKRLRWERNGKIYSFREWMSRKYKTTDLYISEEDLEREASNLVNRYRACDL